MPHPIMFRDDDPLLARVRRIALAYPGAAEKVSHGRPVFYTAKIFAHYGGSVKVDSEWVPHSQSVLVLPDPAEHEALLNHPRVFVPGYIGAYGWLGLDLADTEDAWAEVAELIDTSYRNTAGKRRVAELDASGSP